MKKINLYAIIITVLIITRCGQNNTDVEIVKTESGYQLHRFGEPYYIKGAGIEGHYDILKQAGGNSIRTWGVDAWPEIFQMAEKYDLTVCAGIWLEQERQGFDYSDEAAVADQFERIKQDILEYKDHPQLLMWNVGNELDLDYTDPIVWNAVEQVAAFIKSIDKDHPVTTTTAFIEEEEVELIQERCPSLDLLCINAYAGLPVVSQFLQDFGWDGPYIMGEWGTFGHWEVPKTEWGEPIEFTSKEKAELYQQEYKEHILTEPNCLGAYVFFWGAKQERTPTWYGMFMADGARTQAVDVMYHLWKGEWPADRAPILDSLRIDGLNAHMSITMAKKSMHTAKVWARDPENEDLRFRWEILHETQDKSTGGDEEQKPPQATIGTMTESGNELRFSAPQEPGPYRLFVYVYDPAGNGAHANIPFYVKKQD
ncbi:MAG: glycoside hydrolase family 2 TIM barrel-domain containing protein [Fidelibacterota bacterium]